MSVIKSARRRNTMFAALSLSAAMFSSKPVLAEQPFTCIYRKPDKIEYLMRNMQFTANIDQFVRNFGDVINLTCGKRYTYLVLKNAIIRIGGSDIVRRTGSTDICMEREGRMMCKVADIERFYNDAIHAEIEWGKVAVVVFNDLSVVIYKGLDKEDTFVSINAGKLDEVDLRNIDIKILGDEINTRVAIHSGRRSLLDINILGTSKYNIKIKENID